MHNFARECQSAWRKNFLSHIRFVAILFRVKVSNTKVKHFTQY